MLNGQKHLQSLILKKKKKHQHIDVFGVLLSFYCCPFVLLLIESSKNFIQWMKFDANVPIQQQQQQKQRTWNWRKNERKKKKINFKTHVESKIMKREKKHTQQDYKKEIPNEDGCS